MTGSVVFMADLMRHLPIQFRVEPVRATSYVGATTVSTQSVKVEGFDKTSLCGCHVLIVDDVLDSGRTITRLRAIAEEAEAASVMVCVLLPEGDRTGRALRVRWIRHSRRIRRGLRARLQRAVPESAGYCRASSGSPPGLIDVVNRWGDEGDYSYRDPADRHDK